MGVEILIEVFDSFPLTGGICFNEVHIVIYVGGDAACCDRVTMCDLYHLTGAFVILNVHPCSGFTRGWCFGTHESVITEF